MIDFLIFLNHTSTKAINLVHIQTYLALFTFTFEWSYLFCYGIKFSSNQVFTHDLQALWKESMGFLILNYFINIVQTGRLFKIKSAPFALSFLVVEVLESFTSSSFHVHFLLCCIVRIMSSKNLWFRFCCVFLESYFMRTNLLKRKFWLKTIGIPNWYIEY